jgi:hypothetical protein
MSLLVCPRHGSGFDKPAACGLSHLSHTVEFVSFMKPQIFLTACFLNDSSIPQLTRTVVTLGLHDSTRRHRQNEVGRIQFIEYWKAGVPVHIVVLNKASSVISSMITLTQQAQPLSSQPRSPCSSTVGVDPHLQSGALLFAPPPGVPSCILSSHDQILTYAPAISPLIPGVGRDDGCTRLTRRGLRPG